MFESDIVRTGKEGNWGKRGKTKKTHLRKDNPDDKGGECGEIDIERCRGRGKGVGVRTHTHSVCRGNQASLTKNRITPNP